MIRKKFAHGLIVLFLCVIASSITIAQDESAEPIASFDLGEIIVYKDYQFNSNREEKKYNQLNEDLTIIYPLLMLVKNEYDRVNRDLQLYQGERAKKFMKWYENYAKESYMHHLSVLNGRQGRLFMELISRELKTTAYNLIKEYRNGFKAVIWQVAANLYFANLKVEYNAKENPMIEHILKRLESEYKVSNPYSASDYKSVF